MSDQNAPYPDQHAAPESTPAGAPRFVDQAMSQDQPVTEPTTNAQHGLGPFTLREWIVMGLAVVLLVLSFFAAVTIDSVGMHASVWSFGLTWLGAALFPFAAGVLIAVRRFAPRVQFMGAFSVDQFASVAFCVAAFLWLNLAIILGQLSSAMGDMLGFFGGGSSNPVSVGATVWIAFVVSLAGIFFTVVARFVPPFAEDFTGREETTAHVTARPARQIVAAPKPARTAQHASPYPYPYPAAGEQGGSSQQAPYGQHPAAASQDPYAAPAQQYPYAAPAQQNPYADPAQQNPYAAPAQQDGTAAPGQQDAYGAPAQQYPYAAPAQENLYAAPVEQDAPVQHDAHATPVQQDVADVPAEQGADSELATPDATDAPAPAPAVQEPAVQDAADAPAQEPVQHAEQTDPATSILPVAEQTDDATQVFDAVTETSQPEYSQQETSPQEAPSAQPFWALAPEQREVHDFEGRQIYTIGPTAWALVLEDRGSYFVMRHDDGRIGYLHDTSNITRG